MSAHRLTAEERVAALKRFGYGELEASFLCLAALHSGYFLRRQFAQFLGCRDGGTVTQFVHRLLALWHARSSTWRQNTQLYHLYARPLYDALGEPDNRNRRQHQWSQVKNKIMALDFVLAHRDVQYLASEQEKLEYLTDTLKIDPTRFPAKRFRSATGRAFTTRYFVDKYPVFVPHDPANRTACVSFCFVDEGLVSLSRFESYLTSYWPLFESLPGFQLIYVAATNTHFAGARAMFERFRMSDRSGCGAGSDPIDTEGLLTYFKLRDRYERHELSAFGRPELIRLRDARASFSSPEIEALYLTWQASGDAAVGVRMAEKPSVPARVQGTFSTELLTHDYGLFGNVLPH